MPHLAALKQSTESGSKVLVKHLTGSKTIKKQKLQDLGDAAYIPGQDKMEVENEELKSQPKPAAKKANPSQTKPTPNNPTQTKPTQPKQQNGATPKPTKVDSAPVKKTVPAKKAPSVNQTKVAAKPKLVNNNAKVKKIAKK